MKNKTLESRKQKNYTRSLDKRERVKYFANLDLHKYTDNINMFSGSGNKVNNITLI